MLRNSSALWRILPVGLWPGPERGACNACIRGPAPLRPNTASSEASPVLQTATPSRQRLLQELAGPHRADGRRRVHPPAIVRTRSLVSRPCGAQPPRWKMALLTWIAVWPVSILVSTIVASVLGRNVPQVVQAALVAAGLVAILTWVAMPPLVKIAHSWLHPKSSPDGK